MTNEFRFVVDEPTDVVGQDGATVIGQVTPGTRYRAVSSDEHWISMQSPAGELGYVLARRITRLPDQPAATPPPPTPPQLSRTPAVSSSTDESKSADGVKPAGSIRRPFTLAAAAATGVGVFLPWFEDLNAIDISLGVFLDIEAVEDPAGGYVLLAIAAALAVLAFSATWRPGLVRLLGFLPIAMASSIYVQFGDGFFEYASIGWYVTVAGGLLALFGPKRGYLNRS